MLAATHGNPQVDAWLRGVRRGVTVTVDQWVYQEATLIGRAATTPAASALTWARSPIRTLRQRYYSAGVVTVAGDTVP